MNLKRFTARNTREALALVKAAFGDDAVVVSTKPCDEGVEVLAMAPDSLEALERAGAQAETVAAAAAAAPTPVATPRAESWRDKALGLRARAAAQFGIGQAAEPRTEPALESSVEDDVAQLNMSTLSFQEYVRQRMLRRREAEQSAAASSADAPLQLPEPLPPQVPSLEQARARRQPAAAASAAASTPAAASLGRSAAPARAAAPQASSRVAEVPVLRDEWPAAENPGAQRNNPQPRRAAHGFEAPSAAAPRVPARGEQIEVMSELRSMRGLIEQRFGAIAILERLERSPRQASMARRLLDVGFSPMLVRKLLDSLPETGDEMLWATRVLERNLLTGENDAPLEDQGGVHALIGATGVGKTTTTAKLAAAFATKYGAANLGLITLDAYRLGAHEQLRAYGRILGVAAHTAHDRDSLEDLLDLLSGKRLVLIDTAGMAQRDSRNRELMDMIAHPAIRRLLVVNASAQGETIEDQLVAYGASHCEGIVLSKLDEVVKLAPALDAMMRHKLKVLGVANGQRVPEDWHRLSSASLVQRALKVNGGAAWQMDDHDVNLLLASTASGRAAEALRA